MRTANALSLVSALLLSTVICSGQEKPKSNVEWFQSTEQALMDALVPGEKAPWHAVLDEGFVATDEEGRVLTKEQFLSELGPLPAGLTGGIAVRELTVQEFPGFAVVRYLADEWESVFGQRITTKYRTTDTFRKAGSTWKLVASHTAVVTADPPAQAVATDRWPALAGRYRLLPKGWTFHVAYRDGKLYGGRDVAKLKPLIPLTSDAFVLQGSLGEWMFAINQDGKPTHIVNLRKFEPLVWTRISDSD
jgi:uncharacterized protein DUF4440